MIDDSARIPRYVRVNTLLWTTEEAIQAFGLRGYVLSGPFEATSVIPHSKLLHINHNIAQALRVTNTYPTYFSSTLPCSCKKMSYTSLERLFYKIRPLVSLHSSSIHLHPSTLESSTPPRLLVIRPRI
jgi:hypothetical protein